MEKIIAVVVMIAIVIGLIATAVLPMVNQMNEQGSEAQTQLAGLTGTMTGNALTGAGVKAEIKSNVTKFSAAGTDKLESITIISETGATLASITAPTGVATGLGVILDGGTYIRTQTSWPSGKVKTYTYTLQNMAY